jgi:hypothetical protein
MRKLDYSADDLQSLYNIRAKVKYLNNMGGNLQSALLNPMEKDPMGKDAVESDLKFIEGLIKNTLANKKLINQVRFRCCTLFILVWL